MAAGNALKDKKFKNVIFKSNVFLTEPDFPPKVWILVTNLFRLLKFNQTVTSKKIFKNHYYYNR